MGNRSSRSSTDIVIDIIAETIVNSFSSCIASVENDILIFVGVANNVKFDGINIEQISTAEIDCQHDSEITLSSSLPTLKSRLNSVINTKTKKGNKNEIIDKLVKSISARSVAQCMATAINKYEVKVQEVLGDVSIVNLSLKQIAIAQIKECLSSNLFVIDDQSVQKFLESSLTDFDIVEEGCADATKFRKHGFIILGCSILLSLIFLILMVMLSIKK